MEKIRFIILCLALSLPFLIPPFFAYTLSKKNKKAVIHLILWTLGTTIFKVVLYFFNKGTSNGVVVAFLVKVCFVEFVLTAVMAIIGKIVYRYKYASEEEKGKVGIIKSALFFGGCCLAVVLSIATIDYTANRLPDPNDVEFVFYESYGFSENIEEDLDINYLMLYPEELNRMILSRGGQPLSEEECQKVIDNLKEVGKVRFDRKSIEKEIEMCRAQDTTFFTQNWVWLWPREYIVTFKMKDDSLVTRKYEFANTDEKIANHYDSINAASYEREEKLLRTIENPEKTIYDITIYYKGKEDPDDEGASGWGQLEKKDFEAFLDTVHLDGAGQNEEEIVANKVSFYVVVTYVHEIPEVYCYFGIGGEREEKFIQVSRKDKNVWAFIAERFPIDS